MSKIIQSQWYFGTVVLMNGEVRVNAIFWPIVIKEGIVEKAYYLDCSNKLYLIREAEIKQIANTNNTERGMEAFKKSHSVYCNVIADDYYREREQESPSGITGEPFLFSTLVILILAFIGLLFNKDNYLLGFITGVLVHSFYVWYFRGTSNG